MLILVMLHYNQPLAMINFFRKIRQNLLLEDKTGISVVMKNNYPLVVR